MALMMLSLLLVPASAAAAQTNDTSKSDIGLARQSGQSFVNEIAITNSNLPNWKGATITTLQLYHDLTGTIDSYMFAISSGNKIVGHVLVGNSSYGYPIFEAGEAAPPTIPSTSDIIVSMQKSFGVNVSGKNIGNLISLLYLGIDEQYGVYSINGELVGINLVYGDAVKLSTMKFSLPSPIEYKSNQVEANSTLTAEAMSVRPMYTINFLFMGYYSNSPNRVWCGPCSGVSIGHYFKWYSATGHYYPNLPDDDSMYDVLYYQMQAAPWVLPPLYGPGWVYMAQIYGYNNFRAHWYTQVGSSHYFAHIVPDIDKGWPHALCCYPQSAHWRAIKGYDYSNGTHKIICTNSATSDSWEYLNWDSLPSTFHDTVCLHDDGS
jgi:hypothetical protein